VTYVECHPVGSFSLRYGFERGLLLCVCRQGLLCDKETSLFSGGNDDPEVRLICLDINRKRSNIFLFQHRYIRNIS